jgi:hypothetical protein
MITDVIHDYLTTSQFVNTIGISDEIKPQYSDGLLLQPYTSFSASLSRSFDLDAGFRYVRYTYNNTQSFEPRVMLKYRTGVKSSFDVAYGIVGQMQLPATYFAGGNKNLGLAKAHHFNVAHHVSLSNSLKLNTELYYQHLFNLAVEKMPSTFNAVNLLENFAPSNLVNNGVADNYGINMTLEKSFYQSNYFMVGGSYYESNYKGSDGVKHNTQFNGKYTFNATYGKEWKSQKKNRVIGLNTRLLYLGGLRETPIDVAASQASGQTVRDNTRPFENKLGDYFRIDMRLSFRKNMPKYTRTLAFDLQNVTGQQNEAYHYYDFTQKKVVTQYQLGLIPVIVYRIDF